VLSSKLERVRGSNTDIAKEEGGGGDGVAAGAGAGAGAAVEGGGAIGMPAEGEEGEEGAEGGAGDGGDGDAVNAVPQRPNTRTTHRTLCVDTQMLHRSIIFWTYLLAGKFLRLPSAAPSLLPFWYMTSLKLNKITNLNRQRGYRNSLLETAQEAVPIAANRGQ